MASDETSKHHIYTHPSPVEHWRHAVEIAALIIAAAWAFYVFVYQERIKPAREAPALDLRPGISTQHLQDGRLLVSVSLSAKNIGPVELQLAAEAMTVHGFKYGPRMVRRSNADVAAGQYGYSNSLPPSKLVLLASSVFLFRPAGMSATDWNGFAPGNEKTFTATFAVPANDFDAVKIDQTACYTRLDDRRVVAIKPRRMIDGGWDTAALAATLRKTFYCGYTPSGRGFVFAL